MTPFGPDKRPEEIYPLKDVPRVMEPKMPEQHQESFLQRHVNVLWEVTQSIIALAVTGTGMYVWTRLALDPDEADKAAAITAFLLISNMSFLIIGLYFGRTNHARKDTNVR